MPDPEWTGIIDPDDPDIDAFSPKATGYTRDDED